MRVRAGDTRVSEFIQELWSTTVTTNGGSRFANGRVRIEGINIYRK